MRIYVDDRFEGLQIRHAGGSTYNVWLRTVAELPGHHMADGWANVTAREHFQECIKEQS